MNPVDITRKARARGLDKGRLNIHNYRGFKLRSNGEKVLIVDSSGIWGEAETLGAAVELVNQHLGPSGSEAA